MGGRGDGRADDHGPARQWRIVVSAPRGAAKISRIKSALPHERNDGAGAGVWAAERGDVAPGGGIAHAAGRHRQRSGKPHPGFRRALPRPGVHVRGPLWLPCQLDAGSPAADVGSQSHAISPSITSHAGPRGLDLSSVSIYGHAIQAAVAGAGLRTKCQASRDAEPSHRHGRGYGAHRCCESGSLCVQFCPGPCGPSCSDNADTLLCLRHVPGNGMRIAATGCTEPNLPGVQSSRT